MSDKNLFRMIPKVDELLKDEKLSNLLLKFNKDLIQKELNFLLESIRTDIKSEVDDKIIIKKINDITIDLENRLNKKKDNHLRRVINATGTVLHTNLGRSLLPREVSDKVSDILSTYSNLEFDLATGKRGSRYSHVENLLCDLTGAESALVVNNNAAAVLLVLNTFAKGKEVIISRGELIEIGGSFRIPDVMESSGCKLVEVGTTNKTHKEDYIEKITEETGALMKVHTSNYRIYGFTEGVKASELREIATKKNIPLIEDLGSGILIDLENYGLTHEPTVRESILNGIDVVTFSGDKLLGGPQAGIIVGKKEFIDKLKKNQLTRALRVDKMTFKALEEILKIYLKEDELIEKIPTLSMLTMSYDKLLSRVEKLKDLLSEFKALELEVEDSYSEVGGGSLPTEELKAPVLKIRHKSIKDNRIDEFMRKRDIPIVARIKDSFYIIDTRTLLEEDFTLIKEAFKELGEV